MEAGMSALSAVEAPIEGRSDGVTTDTPGLAPSRRRLRLVQPGTVPGRTGDDILTPDDRQPRTSSIGAVPPSPQKGDVLIPSAVIAPRQVRARNQVSSPPPL